MCGIAGLILAPGAPPPDPAMLSRLIDTLEHRGPDGTGHAVVGRVALVHNRLAIIDLVTGDQPLFAGPATLVCNGEIYNYRELRVAMPDVALRHQQRLRAAFASVATRRCRLRAAPARHVRDRDPRARPAHSDANPRRIRHQAALHHADRQRPRLRLRAAGAAGRRPRARAPSVPAAREELLQLQFTTGTETIFEGIQRLLPGETITCADGHILDRRRVSHIPEGGPENIDEDEALARLDRALEESVDLHQRADVPYGMFLSGGIDSSTLLAMMARLNSQPVLAYTAGFDAPGAADEREHAATVAKALGAKHESIEINEKMVWEHLPEIVGCMDDPAADYAIIPTWFLAQRARQDVKVVLSGEGGDEIFAGYGRYRSAMRPWWLGGRTMWARGSFDRVDVLRTRPASWRDGIAAAEVEAAEGGRSRLAAAQATDMADWLPHDLLLKLDRCLMAHAVEGRTPFLDPGIAKAAFRLPDAMKLRDGVGKWILRKWLEKHLPIARPFAPKQGFTVPVGEWIKGQGSRLGPLVAAQPGIAEIADPAKVRLLFANIRRWRHGFAAWKLLFYALWHRRHILALPPAGDVFQTLAAT